MTDITSSNSSFSLNVPAVFAAPVTLQGYSTDDAFSTAQVDIVEKFVGVDGFFSAGVIPYLVEQDVIFQADSPSIILLETWLQAMAAARQAYFGNGVILLPSIKKQYVLGPGILSRITPIPQAKKVLQPVTYQITWQGPVVSAPTG